MSAALQPSGRSGASELVWYIAYGSNLSGGRFEHYLRGGVLPNSDLPHTGAEDPRPAIRSIPLILPNRLFFAGHSKRWAGGVAYVSASGSPIARTLARGYLLRWAQVRDVILQESGARTLTLEELRRMHLPGVLRGALRYETVIGAARIDGQRALTITSSLPPEQLPRTPPSAAYLNVMANGLRESFRIADAEIAEYLFTAEEVSTAYTLAQLRDIVRIER